MNYRIIGKSEIAISEVGFGTIPILSGPCNILPRYFNLSDAAAVELLREAFDRGITFYDTSVIPEYGDAERKLGQAFRKDRDRVVLASKARAYTNDAMQAAIEKSLRHMNTDYLDIYSIHEAKPSNLDIILDEKKGALRALLLAQEKGQIREIGIGTHYATIAGKFSRMPNVAVIQIPYNVLETGIYDTANELAPEINGKLVLNKIFAGGILTHHFSISGLLGVALNLLPVSVLVGIGTKLELGSLLDALASPSSIDVKDLASTFEDAFLCNRCQKCECPNGVHIHHLLRYRAYALLGFTRWAKEQWFKESPSIKCEPTCTKCLHSCPRDLDIPRLILGANSYFIKLLNSKED